ncbi:hypothetical protein S510_003007 [Salmonella enterica subsp. arizonae]|nr:hypothetical protein [Salmonella enterica]EBH9979075.1 hypothetical protein [Salmonella enterica subsp. arizonae serovar 40:z36:-]EDS6649873.1 hypothetical protein [Salmonella enterica subsp. arizonae]EEF7981844.1 hypothetical protein [Salmonella enterica subsp. arizonae serovar 40:z4,z32:-]EDU9484231.1 hypothetical protein [Salmonella enterica subsp. arizonae]
MALWSLISLSLILFSIKILAYIKATPSEKMWNEKNTCYAITYIPNYKPFGGAGRVLRLFSNQSFFVVYDKTGEKIKSSAWYFWEYQFSDLVAPEWSGIDFLYPSDNGFSGWTLPECKKIKTL